jgi:3(or 17)beta-hydroxysteroid dehydrogenase
MQYKRSIALEDWSMSGRVAGKVAIVTGAASGIGAACARGLAREGARVVLTDIAQAEAESAAAGIARENGTALALRHDVTAEKDWAAVIEATIERFGHLDVLVNNAGIASRGSLLDTTLDDWRALMRVNLDVVFLGTRAAIGAMQAAGRPAHHLGSVINMSSVLGLVGGAGVAAYSASKGAVRLFTKAVALECAERGWRVRVNSVHPGYISTTLLETALARRASLEGADIGALRAQLVERHPLGRLGTPEDVASGVVYLASDESAFVTGCELVIDGGPVGHIRNTPHRVSGIGALSVAAKASASTRRVSAGAMMPSSHSRAVA